MKLTYVSDEEAQIAFARTAAAYFADSPDKWTYGGGPTPGEFLALRWSAGESVLVLRVDESFEPVVYMDLVRHYGAKS